MTDITLQPIKSGYNLQKINDNFETIEANINTTSIQSTDGNNVMQQDLDMNSNAILNLPKPLSPTNPVRLQDITLAGLEEVSFNEETFSAVTGTDTYVLTNVLNTRPIIHIDGRLQNRLKGDFSINTTTNSITFTEPVFTGQDVVVWTSPIVTGGDGGIGAGASSFSLLIESTTVSLTGVEVFTTLGGITEGDNFGAVFASTGITIVGNASTINTGAGLIYDKGGLEFKHVTSIVRLETFGVLYTEAASVVLGYTIALRGSAFSLDLSPRYNLTTFAGQHSVHRGQKEYIMHRSFAKLAPENTLLGWSMGWNRTNGLMTAMEVDVQITVDGVPVCFHNLTVDSTTDGTGEIKDLTLAQLKALTFTEVVGTAMEGNVTIPTFDEFLEYASFVGAKIYPEIKGFRTDADIELINDVVRKYRYEAFTTYSFFDIARIEKLREFNQQSAWAWATDAGVYTQSDIDRLVAVGGQGNIWQSLNEWTASPTDVDVFHAFGWDVGAYTVTRAEHVQDMARIGVHKLHCDINPMPSASLTATTTQRRFNMNPWSETKTGAGTVIYTANPENNQTIGELVDCEAASSEDARVRLPFSITAGETVQMSVIARNIGSHVSNSQIDIDHPIGVRKETINIIGTDFIEYTVAIQAPYNETFAAYTAAFVLGTNFSRDSGGRFYRPIIRSSDSMYGSTKVIMDGMLIIAQGGVAGTHLLNVEVNNSGVDTVLANGSNIAIRPQNELSAIDAGLGKHTAKATLTPTGTGQATLPLAFFADAQGSTGTVNIGAINTTTGAVVNLNTITSEHKLYFKVEL